jgi:hypothetical protein
MGVAQGCDVGSQVTDAMGRVAPEGLIGIHTNLPLCRRTRPSSGERATP